MERTCLNGELRLSDVGRQVTLLGWVHRRRDHGGLFFFDLRDRSGLVQVLLKKMPDREIRNECVVWVKGVIGQRATPNPKLRTGEIEVIADDVRLLSSAEETPLIIGDETDALEETRLRYRYLDLRRPVLQRNLALRARIVKTAHEYFDAHGFLEIETPCLTLSTPEGARDYLVPSRVNQGAFYALPQSPQLYKQLLMIAGFERYYQIARCFRDEDLRQDRQPEFTQIDAEASFLDQDEIMTLMEGFIKEVFFKTLNVTIKTPLRRMSYLEAVEKYGSEHPDTRFGMTLFDVSKIMKATSFPGFEGVSIIKGITVPGVAVTTSRRIVDRLVLEAKKFKAAGLSVFKVLDGHLSGGLIKFLTPEKEADLLAASKAKDGDLLIIAWGERSIVSFLLGSLRVSYAHELGLIEKNTYDVLWVVDFPLFEKEQMTGGWKATHHPFTLPTPETVEYLSSDPAKVFSAAYDLIVNGSEVGGGSLRIHDPDLQKKVFKVLGLSEEDVQRKFSYFVDAFRYGTPPHGGIAFGLERLAMIICGTENIRDVIAFPKNLKAVEPMSGAPRAVDQDQLDDLGIIIK